MDQHSTLKGFRDFLPEQMRLRKQVINILEEVFEQYGFEPLQTPTLEYKEVLTGKYGEEADKLMYLFTDRGGREIGLNYDLTVPTARVLAQYAGNKITLPFKRYQIQSSYRAENTQRSRYRQFTQCDIDTFGSNSPLADAEILAIIQTALTKLNFRNFTIRLNSRQILQSLNLSPTILQSIDKLDKKSKEEVETELADKGLSAEKISDVFTSLDNAKPDENLSKVIEYAKSLGVTNFRFDPFLVRGLDYYTGPIFETIVEEPKIGSVTGGGRYDQLVKQLGGPEITATGTTIGLDRICDVIEELRLLPRSTSKTQLLITVFSKETVTNSLNFYQQLNSEKLINPEIYLDENTKLAKQIKYANDKQIPYIAIIGPDEIASQKVIIKNLKTGEQTPFNINSLSDITAHVRNSIT